MPDTATPGRADWAPAATPFERVRAALEAHLRGLQRPRRRPIDGPYVPLRLDLTPLLLDLDVIGDLAEIFWSTYGEHPPARVVAVDGAAIALATAIALQGRQRGTPVALLALSERAPTAADAEGPIIAIAGELRTGRSLERAIEACRNDSPLTDAFVIFDHELEDSRACLDRAGVALASLFAPHDFGLPTIASRPRRLTLGIQWSQGQEPSGVHRDGTTPRAVVDQARVYHGDHTGGLHCFDQNTGAAIWQISIPCRDPRGIAGVVVAARHGLLAADHAGLLTLRDVADGRSIWETVAGDDVGPIALSADAARVYAGVTTGLPGRGGAVVAFDIETGARLWHHETAAPVAGTPTLDDMLGSGGNAAGLGSGGNAAGRLYVGDLAGVVHAIDASSGAPAWRHPTAAAVTAAPVVDPLTGLVLVASHDRMLHAIEPATGTLRWRLMTAGALLGSPLLLEDSTALVASMDGGLYRVDRTTGDVLGIVDAGSALAATPTLMAGGTRHEQLILVATSRGELLGLDPARLDVVAAAALPDRILAAPVHDPATDLVFVTGAGGALYALRRLAS